MRIGFVIPWYGAEISGGAEFQCRVTALQLKASGFDVEILTTCVKDFRSDWNQNYHKPGLSEVEGIPVRRFKVRKVNREEFHRINALLMKGQLVTAKDEKTFMSQMIHSDDLVSYMKRHEQEYVFLLIPYMFGTTYFGALACPDRSVLVPCLHDESYAYMEVFKEMFRKARGVIYHAPSEKILAEKIYDIQNEKGALIGGGVNSDFTSNGARFKSKYGLDQYILYAGRKDEGKNIRLLIEYFCAYKDYFGGDLKLVLIGSGKIDIPEEHHGKDVIDLGFVPVQDKYDSYGGAVALCNPSLNESFSIVMMESWLSGTPVLIHEKCHVTLDHCLASQGGLYFSSFSDFVGALDYLQQNPEIRKRLAENGRKYVKTNFAWPTIIQRYQSALSQWGFSI